MNDVSTYPLRLPKSLKEKVVKSAKRDGISVNQFIALAVAEKVSALETERFFAERARRGDRETFRALLLREGGETPRTDDERE